MSCLKILGLMHLLVFLITPYNYVTNFLTCVKIISYVSMNAGLIIFNVRYNHGIKGK